MKAGALCSALHCPLHDKARTHLFDCVRAALLPLGVALQDLGSDTEKVRFLLGSSPKLMANAMSDSATAYRDILRATAAFIRAVYHIRWVRGHQHNVQHGAGS